MKVIFVINSLTPKSGIERVACLLANLFNEKLNYHVMLVNRDTIKGGAAFYLNQNIQVETVAGGYIDFLKGLNKLMSSYSPDAVIIHNMGRLSLLCSMLKRERKTKIISLEHVAFDVRPKWVKMLSKFLYRRIDQVITLTNQDKKSYINFHNNIEQINNISPFDVNSIVDDYSIASTTIISIGRLTYQKNFQSLLEAWEMVLAYNQDWTLQIFGTGEDEENLKNLISERKLKNVYLMGQTTDVQSIYQSAAFYVMSSRFEGLPMVLIEAQSFGLPIISYDCPHGPAEIIESNETGLLVENQNAIKLAESILELMSSTLLREKFSNNARVHAKNYSEDAILRDWLRVIK